jgi:post-segregation antitoxin (ccd killing protein)
MGRKKIDNEKKKVKLAVSIDPDLFNFFKEKSINISSLTNKLLKEYKDNENKSL